MLSIVIILTRIQFDVLDLKCFKCLRWNIWTCELLTLLACSAVKTLTYILCFGRLGMNPNRRVWRAVLSFRKSRLLDAHSDLKWCLQYFPVSRDNENTAFLESRMKLYDLVHPLTKHQAQ